MNPEQFSALLTARHSVRDFLPDPVSDETLDAILEGARHAPSWSNTRPYCVAVATGERLERLRATYVQLFDASLPMQRGKKRAFVKSFLTREGWPDGDLPTWKRYPDELRARSVAVGKALYGHMGIKRSDRAARDAASRRNCELFGAPVGVWTFVHKDLLPFSAQDAGLMLQTLMLSATAHGVGSCPLGVLATWRGPIEAEFQIPKDYCLITGLALGYASDAQVNDFRAEHPPLVQLPPVR